MTQLECNLNTADTTTRGARHVCLSTSTITVAVGMISAGTGCCCRVSGVPLQGCKLEAGFDRRLRYPANTVLAYMGSCKLRDMPLKSRTKHLHEHNIKFKPRLWESSGDHRILLTTVISVYFEEPRGIVWPSGSCGVGTLVQLHFQELS